MVLYDPIQGRVPLLAKIADHRLRIEADPPEFEGGFALLESQQRVTGTGFVTWQTDTTYIHQSPAPQVSQRRTLPPLALGSFPSLRFTKNLVGARESCFCDPIGILWIVDVLHNRIPRPSDHSFSPRRDEIE